MTTQELSDDHSAFAFHLFANVPSVLVTIFVIVTMSAVFVPLNPDMPDKIDEGWVAAHKNDLGNSETPVWLARLDPSWMLAMNAAVARHLRFGKEIVFTYGPYGSILYRSYHPATDRLMILGSLLLCASYITALFYLSWGRKPYIVLALVLFCATFPSGDALFLSYPFLVVVCALKFMKSDGTRKTGGLRWWQIVAVIMVLSGLGLLPLIKGSLILPMALAYAVLAFFFLRTFALRLTIPLLFAPIVSAIILWVLAGQRVSDLHVFLRATGWIVSGYTDAMSLPWLAWPGIVEHGFIVLYLLLVALVYVSFLRSERLKVPSKWLLSLLCGVFFFVAFKHGFVRAAHLPLAFESIVLFSLVIGLLSLNSYLVTALGVAFVIVVGVFCRMDPVLITGVKAAFGSGTVTRTQHVRDLMTFIAKRSPGVFARTTYKATAGTYASAWEGLRLRSTHGGVLEQRFEKSLENIRTDYAIPQLTGTVDIYTYAEAVLLASNNAWNPRPVVQSYSAYTPDLARIDEQHLRGGAVPDWIAFEPTTIDGRLPAEDDGLSWPALLDNYTFSSFDGRFAFLRKKPSIQARSDLEVIYRREETVSRIVSLPEAGSPIYAEIDIRPTLAGRLMSLLYRPPQLSITLNLKDGETRSYRIVSNMTATGFVLSPLVHSAQEFVGLATHDLDFENRNKVTSIFIAPSYGGSIFWSARYWLTLKTYRPG